MSNPDFTSMDYAVDFPTRGFDDWKAAAEKASGKSLEELISQTMEHIDVKFARRQCDLAQASVERVDGRHGSLRQPDAHQSLQVALAGVQTGDADDGARRDRAAERNAVIAGIGQPGADELAEHLARIPAGRTGRSMSKNVVSAHDPAFQETVGPRLRSCRGRPPSLRETRMAPGIGGERRGTWMRGYPPAAA